MRVRRETIALTVSLLAVRPTMANGQAGGDVAARRLLLDRARAARSAGNHEQALDLAERAGRIEMTSSIRRFIAEEQDQLGNVALALGTAELCVRDTEHEPASPNRTAVRTGCNALARRLHARVGYLVVRAPAPAPDGLRIRVAGNPLNEAFWGAPYVVTPGNILVEASASDRAPFRTSIAVATGATVTLEVNLATAAAATEGFTPAPAPASTARDSGAPAVASATDANTASATATATDATMGTVRVLVSAASGVPSDVRILFDGMPVTGTPPTIEHVPAGDHILEVSATGFRPVRQEIPVQPARMRVVAVDLERIATTGTLQVNVPAPGAAVYIDGVFVGPSPISREVPAGPHALEVRAAGYQSVLQTMNVQAGQVAFFQLPGLPLAGQPLGGVAPAASPGAGPLQIGGSTSNSGNRTLAPGFRPDIQRIHVNATGTIDARTANLGPGCSGFVTRQPDVILYFQGSSPSLRLFVNSRENTTLVINAPDGTWRCNDDASGINPLVDLPNTRPGQYNIWVGAPRAGIAVRAQLTITELNRRP